MASVFTFDPDPPRVSSPWLAADDDNQQSHIGYLIPKFASEYGLTKLQAEPERGPTEYKLHLLLRPRRVYTSMSTTRYGSSSPKAIVSDRSPLNNASTSPKTSSLPQRERLKHLTTQLLWRLQQSSPYHASGSDALAVPKLPGHGVEFDAPSKIERLVPGLRESRGALYELGVSDDGTLVGLTEDEMDDSIATLRLMAASLGCAVDVVRMVIVGDCEWVEPTEPVSVDASTPREATQWARLWVAEALVTPILGCRGFGDSGRSPSLCAPHTSTAATLSGRGSSTPQLRVTLTGPTTSGKSSLLGTLSTGTLDNGRGKSRLSLLKHRHEIVSGVTSSIAQELIGYKDEEIINFARANIESWVDIHDSAENGRLVFVSDSGGHPRYRRSVLRGLMSWASHWSILCIAADGNDDIETHAGGSSTAPKVLTDTPAEKDLVKAHLALALKLNMPMAIVITKLDLASKSSLHRTMARVLTSIKEAGRIPRILHPDQRLLGEPNHISPEDRCKVQAVLNSMAESGSLTSEVPILLTSAVRGTGIGLVHALFARLPLSPMPASWDFTINSVETRHPNCLFHIDDTFRFPESHIVLSPGSEGQVGQGVIASGHVRFGSLSVGDTVVIGPFQSVAGETCGSDLAMRENSPPGSCNKLLPRPSIALPLAASKDQRSRTVAVEVDEEWRKAKVVSIRNLRLPVFALEAGQAGSIGLVFEPDFRTIEPADEPPRIRRGMVLALTDGGLSLQAASIFTAVFSDPKIRSLVEGSLVQLYFTSVRAVARAVGICHHDIDGQDADEHMTPSAGVSNVMSVKVAVNGNAYQSALPSREAGRAKVTLELLHSREWIGVGCTILLLETGSRDKTGLEGFVGRRKTLVIA
ncbi:hypothetical protein XA68_10356 [Ophiocordyceps unilateralis]|uniref:Tr-type G domain-containing protein n=1 Tax=Ophiocordyceps unilateralis TaxID=268505 RepID=A0A2A9NZ85_OPHUN|nr:hypothetical protein XA68_10356 [Ophiocordyceps unilateralis]